MLQNKRAYVVYSGQNRNFIISPLLWMGDPLPKCCRCCSRAATLEGIGQLRGSSSVMRGSRPYQVKLESCPLGGEKQPKLELLAAKHPEPKKNPPPQLFWCSFQLPGSILTNYVRNESQMNTLSVSLVPFLMPGHQNCPTEV